MHFFCTVPSRRSRSCMAWKAQGASRLSWAPRRSSRRAAATAAAAVRHVRAFSRLAAILLVPAGQRVVARAGCLFSAAAARGSALLRRRHLTLPTALVLLTPAAPAAAFVVLRGVCRLRRLRRASAREAGSTSRLTVPAGLPSALHTSPRSPRQSCVHSTLRCRTCRARSSWAASSSISAAKSAWWRSRVGASRRWYERSSAARSC